MINDGSQSLSPLFCISPAIKQLIIFEFTNSFLSFFCPLPENCEFRQQMFDDIRALFLPPKQESVKKIHTMRKKFRHIFGTQSSRPH
jgi:hypothetical protein